MQNQDNIEKLFKEKFEHFESDVNPNIWTNVQSGVHSGIGSAAGAAAKFAVGKIIAGAVALAGIAGSAWYFSHSENKNNAPLSGNKNKTEIISSPSSDNQHLVSENKSADQSLISNSANKNVSSIHSSTHTASDNSEKNNSGTADNTTIEDNSSSDNSATSVQQPAHKYGNATQGDGGMVRENHAVYSKPNSSDNSSASSNDGDAESVPASANIFVTTSSGDAPLTVTFMNQGSASSLVWDFDDGTSSRETSPTHVFDKAGSYEVTLTAKNSAGSTTAKVAIEVKPISSIGNIPNVFTPNGDGNNDVFHFEIKNIASIGVAILSMGKGNVYQWNTLDGSWNGKLMNGSDAPAGIYFYSIQAIGTDGVSHSENGSITLSR